MIIVPTGNGYYAGKCGQHLFSKKFTVWQSRDGSLWYGKEKTFFDAETGKETNPYYEIIKTLSEKVWN